MNVTIPAESTRYRQEIVNLMATLMSTEGNNCLPESYLHRLRSRIEARLADAYANLESAEYREKHGYR